MARDTTLEQEIESDLYAAGVKNSGNIASSIMQIVKDYVNEHGGIEAKKGNENDY